MAKTYDELKTAAIQIRDEHTDKQNTAARVGNNIVEVIDKMQANEIALGTLNTIKETNDVTI